MQAQAYSPLYPTHPPSLSLSLLSLSLSVFLSLSLSQSHTKWPRCWLAYFLEFVFQRKFCQTRKFLVSSCQMIVRFMSVNSVTVMYHPQSQDHDVKSFSGTLTWNRYWEIMYEIISSVSTYCLSNTGTNKIMHTLLFMSFLFLTTEEDVSTSMI